MFSLVVYMHARCVRFLQMRACGVFVPWGPLPMLVGSFAGVRKTATEGAVLRARQEQRLQDVARATTVKLFHHASSPLGVLVYSLIPLSFSRLFSRCISLSLTREVPRGRWIAAANKSRGGKSSLVVFLHGENLDLMIPCILFVRPFT